MLKKCRLFVALLVALLTASLAEAQHTATIPRLCILALYPMAELPVVAGQSGYDAFLRGLHDVGYVAGQSLTIDYLSADGQHERFPTLASECLRLQADIIVVATTPAALAAQHTTRTIPIVMIGLGDPVGVGLVESLARPGGNVTGQSGMAPNLITKRLELLQEVMPHLARVLVLTNRADPNSTPQLRELEEAARAIGVQLLIHDVQTPEDFPAAFDTAATEGAEGLLTTDHTMFNVHHTRIVDNAARYRMPAVHLSRRFADAGGLMSYGIAPGSLWRGVVKYVDKILKGAMPADLPVEQPTQFELILNLKTAQAIGLTIPPTLLFQADGVIK